MLSDAVLGRLQHSHFVGSRRVGDRHPIPAALATRRCITT